MYNKCTVIPTHLYTPVHLHIYYVIQEKKPVFCSESQSCNKGKWVRHLLRGAKKCKICMYWPRHVMPLGERHISIKCKICMYWPRHVMPLRERHISIKCKICMYWPRHVMPLGERHISIKCKICTYWPRHVMPLEERHISIDSNQTTCCKFPTLCCTGTGSHFTMLPQM